MRKTIGHHSVLGSQQQKSSNPDLPVLKAYVPSFSTVLCSSLFLTSIKPCKLRSAVEWEPVLDINVSAKCG